MYVSLASFLLILALYYAFFRPPEFNATFILFFYILVLCSQLSANTFSIYDKCNSSNNFVDALTITLMPWIFVFGVVYATLLFAPPSIVEGLKAPFSNVIGYFIVSGQASDFLNDLLVDPEVSKTLPESNSAESKSLVSTSQVIMKILGNSAILINEITPSNFEQYWTTMTPLMKDEYKNEQEQIAKKQLLLDLVRRRDAVGEMFWLIYTGVFCVALADYQINTLKCTKSAEQIKLNYKDFLEEKKAIENNIKK